MMCVVVPVYPDKANQTQHPRPKAPNLVKKIEVVISPFPKRKVPPYCHQPNMGVMARDSIKGYGSRTIHISSQLVACTSN